MDCTWRYFQDLGRADNRFEQFQGQTSHFEKFQPSVLYMLAGHWCPNLTSMILMEALTALRAERRSAYRRAFLGKS